MTVAELAGVVFGPNGYARYILETGEPGRGHDSAYDYEVWQRARRRLARMDAPAGWSRAMEHGARAAEDVPAPARARQAGERGDAAERGQEFREQIDWTVDDIPLLCDLVGAAGALRLTVTVTGAARHGATGQQLGWSADAPARDLFESDDARADDAAGLPGLPGLDAGPRHEALDSLWSALTGQLDIGGRAAAEDWRAPGVASAGTTESWPARDSAARREQTTFERALALIDQAAWCIAPALGWLAQRSGATRAAASVLEQFFGAPGQRRLHARVEARIPEGARVRPVSGWFTLDRGSLVYHHADDAGEAVAEDRPDHGRIELALRAPGDVLIKVAFTGDMRAVDAAGFMATVQSSIERMLALLTTDIWPALWDPGGRALAELVAHGVHELMPGAVRARLVDALQAGVCDNEEQRAILCVLESSVARGDLAEVIDRAGGRRAVDELLWTMDRQDHTRLAALFQAAGMARGQAADPWT